MAIARDTLYIWTSWLAKLMAGEQACEFSPWFKAHFQYDKLPAGDFDPATWRIGHARLLRELRVARVAAGEAVYVGASNAFRYQIRPGVILAGRPDLVSDDFALSPTACAVKTGQPKTSDWIELLISMHVLPLAGERFRGIQLRGCVIYPDRRIHIPEAAVGPEFISNLDYFVDVLASATAPPKAPSDAECRFCNIGMADCPERWRGPEIISKLA